MPHLISCHNTSHWNLQQMVIKKIDFVLTVKQNLLWTMPWWHCTYRHTASILWTGNLSWTRSWHTWLIQSHCILSVTFLLTCDRHWAGSTLRWWFVIGSFQWNSDPLSIKCELVATDTVVVILDAASSCLYSCDVPLLSWVLFMFLLVLNHCVLTDYFLSLQPTPFTSARLFACVEAPFAFSFSKIFKNIRTVNTLTGLHS